MKTQRNHFLLIKQGGYSTSKEHLTAAESAQRLLEARMWPLWEGTKCQNMVKGGSKVLVYLAGQDSECKKIVASAIVKEVVPWNNRLHQGRYPLLLDGVPVKLLLLEKVVQLETPISVRERIEYLSFAPKNLSKWGVCMMGGMRSLSESDFVQLSS